MLACYHSEARIMLPIPGEVKQIYTKTEYTEWLKSGQGGMYGEKPEFLNPQIKCAGKKATARLIHFTETGFTIYHTLELLKEQDSWYIVDYEYRY